MAEKVKVKLTARCLVDHVIREAGEIVELPEFADDGQPLAVSFGEIQRTTAPVAAAKTADGDK